MGAVTLRFGRAAITLPWASGSRSAAAPRSEAKKSARAAAKPRWKEGRIKRKGPQSRPEDGPIRWGCRGSVARRISRYPKPRCQPWLWFWFAWFLSFSPAARRL